jgi:hypothetical protein
MSFEISASWLRPASEQQASEVDVTMAEFAMKVGKQNVTEFREDDGERSSHLEIPTYYLAEWIAENWWPLLWEPRKSEDDEPNADFLSRHSLLAAQHGFALPRMMIVPFGRSVQVSAGARDVQLADVRFLNGARETFSRDVVESELSRFVSDVVARLAAYRIKDTFLQDAWQLITNTDQDEAQFCRYVGALGLSPYDIEDRIANLIERLLPTLGDRLLMDLCLVCTRQTFEAVATVAEKAIALTKDASISTLSPLGSFEAPTDNMEAPAYRRGVRAAELLRRRFNIKDTDLNGASRVFELLKLDTHHRTDAPRNDDEISVTGAVAREESEMKVALLQGTETKRRFAGARAIFSAWAAESPNESRLLTSAVTRDQQANRAFAAELTAPRNLIRVKSRRGRLTENDVYELAADLQIGLDVVQKQALNNGITVAPL